MMSLHGRRSGFATVKTIPSTDRSQSAVFDHPQSGVVYQERLKMQDVEMAAQNTFPSFILT